MKWDRYAGRDVLPLWVADTDFRAPPAVLEALRERVEHGVFGYTLPPPDLVEAVREELAGSYRWEVPPEWLVWLPGLVVGLNVACRAVGGDGDAVLTTVPVYPPFLSAPGHSRRRLQTAPMRRGPERWELDLECLERAITPRTRLFLLCSPHNPCGRAFTDRELAQVADLCERNDLVLCSDEIHCGLILDPNTRHRPAATLDPAVARRTITLLAPSKTYNLPGLGCSLAVISDPQLRHRFRAAMAGIVPSVNTFGFVAAQAAYRHGAAWHHDLLAYLRANRDRVTRAVAAMPGLEMTPVEATYLAWIDARQLDLADPTAFFEAHGVGLSDGREFGGPGFVRLNFGCTRATLEEALRRMGEALSRGLR